MIAVIQMDSNREVCSQNAVFSQTTCNASTVGSNVTSGKGRKSWNHCWQVLTAICMKISNTCTLNVQNHYSCSQTPSILAICMFAILTKCMFAILAKWWLSLQICYQRWVQLLYDVTESLNYNANSLNHFSLFFTDWLYVQVSYSYYKLITVSPLSR